MCALPRFIKQNRMILMFLFFKTFSANFDVFIFQNVFCQFCFDKSGQRDIWMSSWGWGEPIDRRWLKRNKKVKKSKSKNRFNFSENQYFSIDFFKPHLLDLETPFLRFSRDFESPGESCRPAKWPSKAKKSKMGKWCLSCWCGGGVFKLSKKRV